MAKAIKEHICAACGLVIPKGNEYTRKERPVSSGRYPYPQSDALHNGCLALFQQQQDAKANASRVQLITKALCSHRYEDIFGGRVCSLCGKVDYRSSSRHGRNRFPKRSMRGLH